MSTHKWTRLDAPIYARDMDADFSPQRLLKSEGADFFAVADEIADASEYLESKGLSWDQVFSGNAKAKA